MAPEQIKEIVDSLRAEIVPAVTEQVKLTVNGKIDKLSIVVESIHKRLDAQDEAIAPALETIQTLQSGRRFILWAIPVFAFVGGLIAFLKKV